MISDLIVRSGQNGSLDRIIYFAVIKPLIRDRHPHFDQVKRLTALSGLNHDHFKPNQALLFL